MVSLLHGDCIELLKNLPSESVDVVISDIPYGIDFAAWDVTHKNSNSALLGSSPAQDGKSVFKTRGKPKNGWSQEDRDRPKQFQKFCELWMREIYRVTKPCSPVIVFTGRQNQHRFSVAAEDSGFILKDTLAWDKVTAPFRAQNINKVLERRGVDCVEGDRRLGNLAPNFEPIVWCFKPYGVGKTVTDCFVENGVGCFDATRHKSNILRYSSRVDERFHETQKPIDLMESLVTMFSLPDHTILDPFMGSGTTGVACKNLNRNFIGIELDEGHCKIAKQRMGE